MKVLVVLMVLIAMLVTFTSLGSIWPQVGITLEVLLIQLIFYRILVLVNEGVGLTQRVRKSVQLKLLSGGLLTLGMTTFCAGMFILNQKINGAYVFFGLSILVTAFAVSWRTIGSDLLFLPSKASTEERMEACCAARINLQVATLGGMINLILILMFFVVFIIHFLWFEMNQPLFGITYDNKVPPTMIVLPLFVFFASGMHFFFDKTRSEYVLRKSKLLADAEVEIEGSFEGKV